MPAAYEADMPAVRFQRRPQLCAALKACLFMTFILAGARQLKAQVASAKTIDYSANPKLFPNILTPYKQRLIPPVDLTNTGTASQMIHDGKLELSLPQLEALVVENNLAIAADRYNNSFAQADLLRAKGGQAARGVDTAGAVIPDQFFSAAIGAGVGNVGGLGGIGLTGSVSGTTRTLALTPRGAYDPTLIFNFSWDRTTSPLNTLVVAGVPSVANTTAFYQFGWQQAFTTGTSFAVTLSNQTQFSTQQRLIYDPDIISRITIALIQQLTNGFGFEVNRRFETAARNNISVVRNWFLQQVDAVLQQAANAYWDLVSAQEQLQATQAALDSARTLYANEQKEAAEGILAPLDVLTAQAQVASDERDRTIAQTNIQQQELTLKTFFSKQVSGALADAQVVATDPLPEPQVTDIPPIDQALSTAEQNRPELSQAEGNLANEKLAVDVARNFLKPTVNIFGYFASAGLSGTGHSFQGGLSQELTQLIEGNYPEYAFGLSLTIPLRNRSALADSARASLDERQASISLQGTSNQIGVQVRNTVVGLRQAAAQVSAAINAVHYNKQALDATERKLPLGLATQYDVILAQRDLLAAQLLEVQALAAYAKAQVAMDQSMGILLEKNHISADDAVRGRISHD